MRRSPAAELRMSTLTVSDRYFSGSAPFFQVHSPTAGDARGRLATG